MENNEHISFLDIQQTCFILNDTSSSDSSTGAACLLWLCIAQEHNGSRCLQFMIHIFDFCVSILDQDVIFDPLKQWFLIPVPGTHSIAHFICLLYLIVQV